MRYEETAELKALVRELQRICARLPAAEQYVMVHHPAFRVSKKPFVVAGIERATKGATFSVNLGREMQDQLLDDARFSRTPYIGQHGWVTSTYDKVKSPELTALVTESWRRVANRKQLEALSAAPVEKTAAKKTVAKKKAPVKKAPVKKAAGKARR